MAVGMADADTGLTLFVAGTVRFPEGEPAGVLRRLGSAVGGIGASVVMPRAFAQLDYPGRTERDLDPAGVTCVNLVLEAADRVGRAVTLVNVEDPREDQALIQRWVTPDTLLPLLVRFDGATLSGSESFLPRAVKRFVAGP
jgi:hypothetical protein